MQIHTPTQFRLFRGLICCAFGGYSAMMLLHLEPLAFALWTYADSMFHTSRAGYFAVAIALADVVLAPDMKEPREDEHAA